MALHFSSMLLLLSLLLVSTSFAFSLSRDDVSIEDTFIRQVVGDNNDLLNAEHHFSIFKNKFGKSYVSIEEEHYRLSVFKANMRRALRNQELDPSAEHGVTQFSDLTPREFRHNVLGLTRRSRLRLPSDANKAPILPTDDLPSDFDWRDHGAIGPVKNQVCLSLQYSI